MAKKKKPIRKVARKPTTTQKKRKLPLRAARPETFELARIAPPDDFSKPAPPPLPKSMQKPIHVSPPEALVEAHKKKNVPRAVSAMVVSLAITIAFLLIFLFLFKLDWLLAFGISIIVFAGFAILFYNMLNSKE